MWRLPLLEIPRKSGVPVEALVASAGATDFGAYFWRPELDNTLVINRISRGGADNGFDQFNHFLKSSGRLSFLR